MFSIVDLAEARYVDETVFPLTFELSGGECAGNIGKWFSENQATVDSYLRKHKALLFRCGKAVHSHQDFNAVVESLDYTSMDYIGGAAVRTQLTDRVFTANESPSTERIPFHHEMAQTPHPPTHLFFFCETPPERGGETPILVSAEVCAKLSQSHPQFMCELEEKGVQYVRYMPEHDDPTSAIGRGWRSTFMAKDRGAVLDTIQLCVFNSLCIPPLACLTSSLLSLKISRSWRGGRPPGSGLQLGVAGGRKLEDGDRHGGCCPHGRPAARCRTDQPKNILQFCCSRLYGLERQQERRLKSGASWRRGKRCQASGCWCHGRCSARDGRGVRCLSLEGRGHPAAGQPHGHALAPAVRRAAADPGQSRQGPMAIRYGVLVTCTC